MMNGLPPAARTHCTTHFAIRSTFAIPRLPQAIAIESPGAIRTPHLSNSARVVASIISDATRGRGNSWRTRCSFIRAVVKNRTRPVNDARGFAGARKDPGRKGRDRKGGVEGESGEVG